MSTLYAALYTAGAVVLQVDIISGWAHLYNVKKKCCQMQVRTWLSLFIVNFCKMFRRASD